MQQIVAFLRRVFTLRNFLRIVFASILILALWAAFCIEERWRGRREWERYREAVKHRNIPLEMGAVVPPKIPDAENFAATPMIQQLFDAHEKQETPKAWFSALKLDQVDYQRVGMHPSETMSMEGWRDHFVRHGVISAPGSDPASDVLAALKTVRPELDELREAGRRPGCKFPVHWERGFSAGVPHVSALMQATKVYRLAVAAHLARKESLEAYGYIRDALRVYEAMRNEPALISGLVRIGIIERIAASVREGIANGGWQPAELENIQRDFAGISITDDWRFALNSERALVNTALSELHTRSDHFLARLAGDVFGNQPGQSPPSVTSVTLYPRGWFWLSQRKFNEFFDRSVDRVDAIAGGKPFVLPSDAASDVERMAVAGPLTRLPYILYIMLTPALGNVEAKYLHAMCTATQVQAACALERYRMSESRYAERLEAIVPRFMASLPLDPVAQSPMRYRTNGTGFDLWSVALNRIDDSATTLPKKEPGDQPDWVWRR
jgi:hypothetical protein